MAFFSTTVLGPGSPAFRGRTDELARLVRLCQDEVTKYGVIYGGRQNGKTSLLYQLRTQLPDSVRLCQIDFQAFDRVPPERAFVMLAEHIHEVLPLGADVAAITSAPRLKARLREALAQTPDDHRLVLLLDELGALSPASREALSYALRSFFHERLLAPQLQKLLVIFSGGVELYTMAVSGVSTLHSVCDEIYLPDLPHTEAVQLLADGLQVAGVAPPLSTDVGEAVFARVAGHPYLTQRMGELLVGYASRGQPLTAADVARAEAEIIIAAPPLLRDIHSDMRAYQLEDAARRLLREQPRFSRSHDDLVRLELIGLAKCDGDYWAVRNPLLATAFRERLGVEMPPAVQVATPAVERPPAVPVATSEVAQPPAVPVENPEVEMPPAVPVATPEVAQPPAVPVATPAVEMLPAVPVATPKVERLPAVSVESPKMERLPAVPVATPEVERPSALSVENPKVARPPAVQPWVPVLVRVPAGPFLMGSSDVDPMADVNEKPQHRLNLPIYWIGKTPVTNAQFRPFVTGDGYSNRVYWTAAGWDWREEERIVAPAYWDDWRWNAGDKPVVGVSWFEAVAYCRWLSAQTSHPFRLPSEAEWEKAARGPEGRIWPWGNTWQPGYCNSEEAKIGKATPVGGYDKGASYYAALDMAGNVWEWCATRWGKRYPYAIKDEWGQRALEQDGGRVLRGGSWHRSQNCVRGAYRNYNHPCYRYFDYGLRVVSYSPLAGG
ncbi:SUMF1/EgtB/PvdO family nonheme iron enzyme [Candidatus Oscillochloris fontis]|uniref:SUMF1/EgtB/PvdO family nonheme iron enzyme n=1 Tax=Candidatus Oscillochloris fontis TaxID=2496868 RepID=UPI00101D153F|nr:SUMF1/EgtB/PvdO family nonheme iron enzyme [Candidatus Oscillochloris fontis]